MAALWIKLIFIVVLHSQAESTRCLERDDQTQNRLTSSEPPFDNFYNISKAVYPSVDLPSLLIKITVNFLPAEGTMDTAIVNNSKQDASHCSLTANGTKTCTYTWSMSCLYVSAGPISLRSMNMISLGAIWPNRRERELHLTLPEFCKGPPEVAPQNGTMIYFLSTLQDIAILPHVSDSRLNTVECVIAGHGKAPGFPGLKQLLHGVCWCFLFISLVISTLASQWLVVRLKEWDKGGEDHLKSKIAAVMFLCLIAFFGQLIVVIIAWVKFTAKEELYIPVFFGFVLFVLFRRAFWCTYVHCCDKKSCTKNKCVKVKFKGVFHWNLTLGHGTNTSTNIFSVIILYPAMFMACHHLLWILLGIITEPFWGITVLVAVTSVSAAMYFLAYEFHKAFPSPTCKCESGFWMAVILIPAGFFAFLLLLIVLLVVAQAFLSESLISTIVQNGLVLAATAWFGYLKYDKGAGEGEGA